MQITKITTCPVQLSCSAVHLLACLKARLFVRSFYISRILKYKVKQWYSHKTGRGHLWGGGGEQIHLKCLTQIWSLNIYMLVKCMITWWMNEWMIKLGNYVLKRVKATWRSWNVEIVRNQRWRSWTKDLATWGREKRWSHWCRGLVALRAVQWSKAYDFQNMGN